MMRDLDTLNEIRRSLEARLDNFFGDNQPHHGDQGYQDLLEQIGEIEEAEKMENKNKVRVRFAPSPTGYIHLGGMRTALYNYLFAKKHGGDFVLRIEDTDSTRFVEGAEDYIIESLKWCGIEPNEGVGFGDGPYGPYRQSERKHIYKEYIETLIASGHAYYAFDTPEELDAKRTSVKNFTYNGYHRNHMRNSLTLDASTVDAMLEQNTAFVVRFKMPADTVVVVNDLSRGEIKVNTGTLDDKVLFKSDGMPTYHLANIVDDHLMEITHVIRGEEWLPSAPLHVLLYQAFGWNPPAFCHLALILGPNGKLSKRDMATLGFSVYPLRLTDPETGDVIDGYKEMGFLPEAFNNMLALIGWSPGSNIEMLNMDQMISSFTLEHVSKAGGRFDPKKAEWFSGQYIKKADNVILAKMFMPIVQDNVEDTSLLKYEYIASVCGLLKEKVPYLSKFWESGSYFFLNPKEFTLFDELVTDASRKFMHVMLDKLDSLDQFTHDNTKECFDQAILETAIQPRDAGKILRAAVCGNKVGPPMFDVVELMRKRRVIYIINQALASRG